MYNYTEMTYLSVPSLVLTRYTKPLKGDGANCGALTANTISKVKLVCASTRPLDSKPVMSIQIASGLMKHLVRRQGKGIGGRG